MVIEHRVIENKQYGFYQDEKTVVLLYIRNWNGIRFNGRTNKTEKV